MPKFSVILPCYNAEATITDTLASLQAQTLTDWEAICVDDGSHDATCAHIEFAARLDPRIRLVRNSGKGPSRARNCGAMAHASADLLAFCDADDIWHPKKLESLDAAFADPSVDGAYGQIGFFRATPSDATVFSSVTKGDLTACVLLGENPVCTMSNVAIRRAAFLQSGGFDETMVHNEDLEWLIRTVACGTRIVGLQALHTYYRTSHGGLSTDLDAMLEGRARALETARTFGVTASASSHAIHHRYLARRALRLDLGRAVALRHAITGLTHSPRGFFSPFRRGALTLACAAGATVLPRALRRSLFS
jgi:glycosyltransferase involved in cell wall biosynthesis